MIQIQCTGRAPEDLLTEAALAIPVGESERGPKLPRWTGSLPEPLRSCLAAGLASDAFAGKLGQTAVVRSPAGTAILVGAGKRPDLETTRQVYGHLIQAAVTAKIKDVAAPLPGGRDARAAAEATAVGAILANYQFNTYRTDTAKRPAPVASLTLWEPDARRRRGADRGLDEGRVLAEATTRVRDLVNTPGNDLFPESYAEIARGWCKEAGVKLQVLTPPEIERAKLGAVMAVGAGSSRKPRFLIATYTGRKRNPKQTDIVLVGKGVTFDSGGITLKPALDMWEMRGDMMGSAVMLSTICAAAKLKLPHNLVALMPLVENLPSSTAYRPGDVIRTLSGQTIEIISTDAEGRLILADALTYAQQYKPQLVVDCATLTGAMAVALGDVSCGVFTDHDALWRQVEKASAATGEKAWRMPLFEEYDE
ncbi:MAG TPA: leucyl aminopeptidase family protein, partial [Acidobacteriota bacterium]|nr:leucyl aminopeptidase family protein [Acidobacteriota bacterium]